MRQALKGALISGLIFPGLGQITLKQKKRGWALIAAVVASIVFIVIEVAQIAQQSLQQAQAQGGAQMTEEALKAATMEAMNNADTTLLNIASLLLLALWVYAIIDAWLIGSKQDKQ